MDRSTADREEARRRQESLAALLARAHHALTEPLHDAVKWHGLSLTEWRVLSALSERDGMPMSELAAAVLFKQPTLTKAVDRMEQAQLVLRRTPAEDRRRTLVHLTDHGRQVVAPLLSRARQHDSAVSRALGDAQSRELADALKSLLARLAELPREPKRTRNVRPSDGDTGASRPR